MKNSNLKVLGIVLALGVPVGFHMNGNHKTLTQLSVEDAARIRGASGACYWHQSIDVCGGGYGCGGVTCGNGPGNPVCPSPADQHYNALTNWFTPIYACINTSLGLMDCGLPTQVGCGAIEQCQTYCTAGSPLGAINPTPSKCITASSAPLNRSSTQASGSTCGVG